MKRKRTEREIGTERGEHRAANQENPPIVRRGCYNDHLYGDPGQGALNGDRLSGLQIDAAREMNP